jgi:hypothetical protein
MCHETNEILPLNSGMFLPFRVQIEQNFIVRIKIVHPEGHTRFSPWSQMIVRRQSLPVSLAFDFPEAYRRDILQTTIEGWCLTSWTHRTAQESPPIFCKPYRWKNRVRSDWERLSEKPWSGTFTRRNPRAHGRRGVCSPPSFGSPYLSKTRLPRFWR